MTRAWDGVLALLVALSIALSSALWWQQPQFRELPAAVTPGAPRTQARQAASLTRPMLLMHYPEDQHAAVSPGQPHYDYAWEGVASALRGVRFERLADAPVPTTAEIAARRHDFAVEFTVSGSVPIHEWLETWGITRSGVPDEGPGVTRVLLSLQEPASAIVWIGSGPRLLRTVTSATLRDRLRLLGTVQAGTPWRMLPDRVGDVRIADGIFVPTVTSVPEFVAPDKASAARDPGRVAARFFLDLSVVRTITEHDEALLFTDGQSGLRVYPWGGVEYQRAQSRMPAPEAPSLRTALDRTSQYVQDRDEWPREVHVTGSTRAQGQRTIRFGQRLAGWPVFAATPALEVLFDGTTVVRYTRNANPVVPVSRQNVIVPPETAIEAVAGVAAWRSVTAVDLGYLRPDAGLPGPAPGPASGPAQDTPPPDATADEGLPGSLAPAAHAVYTPVWRVTLTGGMQVMVDAVTGQLPGGEAP